MGSAFARALRLEMEAAAHDYLVQTYVWANSQHYGANPGLKQRAERWAADIEAQGPGRVRAVLTALSSD